MHLRTLTLLTGLFASATGAFSQSGQTLTGTITDTMCGAKHMMTDVSPAQCTRECVKQGSDYGLLSAGKLYTLKGNAKELDKYAGQNVTVTGKLAGSTFTVDTVSPTKS